MTATKREVSAMVTPASVIGIANWLERNDWIIAILMMITLGMLGFFYLREDGRNQKAAYPDRIVVRPTGAFHIGLDPNAPWYRVTVIPDGSVMLERVDR